MAEKCVNCGLVFRTSNELDWHVREEHMKRAAPPPRVDRERKPGAGGEREPVAAGEREPVATGERESAATGDEPPGRPRWLSAARRLLGRRRPESPSGQGRG
jgi:hypothetical protein